MNDAFKHLEEFRFNDDYNTLSNNIYKSLKDIPKLRDEINALASSVHIDTQYLFNVVDKLTKKSDTKIIICTGVTGFDCAAGAYDRTIYIGLDSKVLPMSCEDLSMAMENEEELIKVANESLEINSSETVRKMFSPTGKLMDIGLSGYYLSFILFGRIFGNIDNIEDRIGIIMNYSDGDEVLLEFKLMINS